MLALDAKGLDWTKYHGIRIPYWHPKLKRNAIYIPDFLIKTNKGFILQEMKPYGLVGDPIVQAKAQAAREWCQQNAYQYDIITFPGQV